MKADPTEGAGMRRLYQEAGDVVATVLREGVGLKAALYRNELKADTRAVCKLSAATLGRRGSLRRALVACGLLTASAADGRGARRGKKKSAPEAEEAPPTEAPETTETTEADSGTAADSGNDEGVKLVMAYDMLLGQGLKSSGFIAGSIRAKKAELKAALEEEGPAGKGAGGLPASAFEDLPRYVRINRRLVADDAEAERMRTALGKRLRERQEEAGGTEEAIVRIENDELIPDLLRLHPRSRPLLHDDPEIESGRLVLQDRSSCLSAVCAGITPGTFVLDACSAPGSKTTHALELLGGKGRVVACERDPWRAASLAQRLQLLSAAAPVPIDGRYPPKADSAVGFRDGARIKYTSGGVELEVRVCDFLACDPSTKPFNQAEVILVDPSCSGSGLPEHQLMDASDGAAASGETERLTRLAGFQRRILAHALTFPRARTIVYSTCSVHRVENEDVVQTVLAENPNAPFEVVEAKPGWENTPYPKTKGAKNLPAWAKHCVRCDPGAHRCRGFFLCRLDRVGGAAAAAATPLPPARRRKIKRKGVPAAERKRRKLGQAAEGEDPAAAIQDAESGGLPAAAGEPAAPPSQVTQSKVPELAAGAAKKKNAPKKKTGVKIMLGR